MATFGKMFSRCLSLASQVLPTTRRLHMAADGPGWDMIKGLGKLASQVPVEDPPIPVRAAGVSVNSVILQAAMEGSESLNVIHPSTAAQRLLEHAEAFATPDPNADILRLKPSPHTGFPSPPQAKVSREYGLPTQVWTFKNGRLINRA
ncbi:Hypp5833 [Branchiostoma lanceolatum]|uniref:Hypp5833 protein n=1 Tax=Branchiostoma lanceolatum TaxID=7740 RepID=A0A8J9VFT7_BRALA|nr:Hypp5833 [Branchiostoma lanceolatum]